MLVFPLVAAEADLGPVGRGFRVEFGQIGGFGQVDGIRSIGVRQIDLPVPVPVGFIEDLVAIGFELGQELLGGPFGLLLQGGEGEGGNKNQHTNLQSLD